jgi:DNA polymerase III alpha subunit
MHALKRAGMVKFDLITRKPLTVIRKTLGLIGDEIDPSTVLEDWPWDDEKSFDLLCRLKVGGIPYLESVRARDLLLKWQPREWQDLLALLALLRPPALESGLTESFLQARQNEQPQKLFALPLEQEAADGPEFLLFDVDLARLIARTTGWSLEKLTSFVG